MFGGVKESRTVIMPVIRCVYRVMCERGGRKVSFAAYLVQLSSLGVFQSHHVGKILEVSEGRKFFGQCNANEETSFDRIDVGGFFWFFRHSVGLRRLDRWILGMGGYEGYILGCLIDHCWDERKEDHL